MLSAWLWLSGLEARSRSGAGRPAMAGKASCGKEEARLNVFLVMELGTEDRKKITNRYKGNLLVAEWVIIYNFRGNSDDVPNQTAELLMLLLLGIDVRFGTWKLQ